MPEVITELDAVDQLVFAFNLHAHQEPYNIEHECLGYRAFNRVYFKIPHHTYTIFTYNCRFQNHCPNSVTNSLTLHPIQHGRDTDQATEAIFTHTHLLDHVSLISDFSTAAIADLRNEAEITTLVQAVTQEEPLPLPPPPYQQEPITESAVDATLFNLLAQNAIRRHSDPPNNRRPTPVQG